jgi:transposase
LKLFCEEHTTSKIETKNDISSNELFNWKIEFIENAVKAFLGSKEEKAAKQAK